MQAQLLAVLLIASVFIVNRRRQLATLAEPKLETKATSSRREGWNDEGMCSTTCRRAIR